jgi:hypothetical protein
MKKASSGVSGVGLELSRLSLSGSFHNGAAARMARADAASSYPKIKTLRSEAMNVGARMPTVVRIRRQGGEPAW